MRFVEAVMRGEMGASGVSFFGGFIDGYEFNPKLEGSTGISNIHKMRADPQVQAAESIVTLPVRTAEYSVVVDEGRDDVKEFLEDALFHRLNWQRFIQHALMAFSFGFEVMEKVVVEDGGKWYFQKLSHRGQETIEKWFPAPDDSDRIDRVQQRVWKSGSSQTIVIPGEKLFHLAWDQMGNNFVGRSGLRAAYKPWFIKETSERIGAIGIERWGLGIPGWEMPQQYSDGDEDAAVASAESFRAGEKAYVMQPFGWKFKVFGSGDAQHYDALPWIRYCDEMIATSVLAMVLSLGKTETGSRALGETMLDLFLLSLEAVADWLTAAVNEQIVKPLVRWNFPNGDDIEAGVEWSNLQLKNVGMASEALDRLVRNDVIRPDDDLEDMVRRWLDAPPQMHRREDEAPPAPAAEPPAPEDPEDGDVPEPGEEDDDAPVAARERARRLAAGMFWRDPLPHESHMSLREIDGRIDDGRDQVFASFAKIKDDWIEEIVHQLREAGRDGDYSDVADIGIPRKLLNAPRSDIVAHMREVYRYGRRSVADEKRRQGRGGDVNLREDPPDSAEVSTLFRTRSTRYLKGLAARLESAAVERAMNILRADGELTDSALRDVSEALVDALDATALNDATVLVGEALNIGRDAAAQAARDEVGAAYYSAILDRGVCDNCIAEDGEEFELGSPDYYRVMPPNQRCRSIASGSNRCRCLFTYLFEES